MIELILAMFLLSLGIAMIAYLIPFSSHAFGRSKQLATALFWAQERMEQAVVWPAAPAELADPQNPDYVGRIERVPWAQQSDITDLIVTVYRAGDPERRPIVQLESLAP